ncbi:hypothetical protein [Alkalicoccus luteus]|uniref:Uncharacterized protein n=1 Tax=Alkalicoccus luteus TaxID=1237094 RepID=A0A969TUK4_9BACI|nr:hypothetical protein [Alkalicoccus luteus]NJP38813.1 hypothetical protein [Alkalicoccus luteus]
MLVKELVETKRLTDAGTVEAVYAAYERYESVDCASDVASYSSEECSSESIIKLFAGNIEADHTLKLIGEEKVADGEQVEAALARLKNKYPTCFQ